MSNFLNKPVVLVGMMGSGKSHVGQALANRLDVRFFDVDSLLEEEQGRSISDIFFSDGEGAFRRMEAQLIERLLQGEIGVISTGGGAVTTPSVLGEIKEHAISVWLQTSVDKIIPRVINDGNRPLLQCGDPKSKLEGLMQVREPLYRQADIHVLNEDKSVDVIVDEIVQALPTGL